LGPRKACPTATALSCWISGIPELGSSPHQLRSEPTKQEHFTFIAAADFSPRWEWEAKGVPALGDGPGPILGVKGPPFSLHLQKDP